MAAKPWYVWNDAKGRFVRSKRPPKDARLAVALKLLKIRLAHTQDRQKLFEFQRESFETELEIWMEGELNFREIREGLDRWTPAYYPNSFVVIAELNRKIVGRLVLVVYYRFDKGSPLAWIEDLFVLKSYRGYKVATRLVEFAKELAEQRGCKALSLIVGLRNLAGLHFYRQCGFWIIKYPERLEVLLSSGALSKRPDETGFTSAYFAHPAEIKPLMESEGFDTLDLIACEGVVSMIEEKINELSGEAFDAWVELNYKLSKDLSIHGAAEHLLYIGRKA